MKNRIAELRIMNDWTQETLAQEVQTSRQTIISIEKDRYDPGIRLAMRLAQVFGTTVEEIFFDE